ncbi:hypothetical protein CYMTET_52959 [Cymbomonas tetramitiformis]|uniref:Uncharacterized protein n=1 Tax=Cymbomonas tetramitiformis TaxID=36881 RepID=A0AAE0EQU4_9CHLO|nr:hypothetical protein CYMTET_52959 [Cymbomonas tetramitiformis]
MNHLLKPHLIFRTTFLLAAWTLLTPFVTKTQSLQDLEVDDQALLLASTFFDIQSEELLHGQTEVPFDATQDAGWNISRIITGSGFHRSLQTHLTRPSKQNQDACEIALVEFLPRGVYANIYELDQLTRMGGPRVHIFGEVDMERPAPHCKPAIAAVRFPLATSDADLHLTLKLHARYPEVVSAGTEPSVVVEIPAPALMQRCEQGRWELQWLRHERDSISWPVPAGSAAHTFLIKSSTIAIEILGASVIVVALIVDRYL